MIKPNKRLFIFLFSLLASNNVYSQNENEWQFTFTPVIWNASVAATLNDDDTGGDDLPIDPDYSFFSLENLNDYLSLKFEANHGHYGILFDSLRARYEDEAENRIAKFNVGTELGFIELSGRYQLHNEIEIDLIVGVRRTFLDIDTTLLIGNNPSTTKDKHSWTDPLIGLRYHYPITKKWHTWVRGDIGGFDVSTQQVVNFTADIQYVLNTHISFSMGYRYLKIDFKEDDILYDVSLNGIQLGLGIHF